jgi:hypothetical protein
MIKKNLKKRLTLEYTPGRIFTKKRYQMPDKKIVQLELT